MAVEFFIPKLGQTVEEVTIVSWLVEDGAKVEQGQPIVEVETDKAVFPVEATASGILHRGSFKEGDIVPVVTTVAIIVAANDRFAAEGREPAEPASETAPLLGAAPEELQAESVTLTLAETEAPERLVVSPRARKLALEKEVDLHKVMPSGGNGMRIVEQDVLDYLSRLPKVSPLAQRVAAEAGVDLETLTGTGIGGRIMKTDVERTLPVETSTLAPEALPPLGDMELLDRIPLGGVRAIIADRTGTSVHTTARVTLVSEVDATEFAAMRERIKGRVSEEWGFAPGFNDLLAKIVAAALRKFPYMNARLTSEAIEYLKPINMGMAVDTERGLLVPVIRNADQKSLRQFGLEFRELVERARNRKSLPDDLSGGTFTITSLGAYGVDAFTPVINLPEAAILGVGRIAPKVVPRDGQAVIRTTCTLSLAFDHRVVDGAPAARFLKYIRELMEEPYLLVSALQE
jgi:pyruvate dehydrogenase E2 component (dihydrolipoamide acetyltransferase)